MPAQVSSEISMDSLPSNIINALEFEKSNRAHPSVSTDPFYTAPPESATYEPGTLLKVERESDTSLYTLAPNLSLSRFMYQSKTSTGSLVPVSGYVLWPYTTRSYHGGYPVVAWAHGTSGCTPESAPSNIKHLWNHFQAPYQLALNGYVVVATDYAGLGVGNHANGQSIPHEYITGPAQANDIAFSIIAAQAAFPELSREFIVLGSSLGGGAAWAFAQRLVNEPMAGHLGTIALSPVTQLLNLDLDSETMPILILLLTPSLTANYSNFKPEDILTAEGCQSLRTYLALNGCNNLLFQLATQKPNLLNLTWHTNTHIQQWQSLAASGGKPISGPLLVIQGQDDPIISTRSVTGAVNETVKAHPQSSQIEYCLLPNVTHASAMYAGQQIYLDWIAARFMGEPAKRGYHHWVARPVRPAGVQQLEANWFVKEMTEGWQAS